ncbi:MAG: 16S rRNA (guanine(527)-N(7))-methyltransferase RsmG [Spirochaetes bacterium]|nr:16S rRNA (guanine(527)-N(7))-methyltransferase RsmG [Spirochaetota bacterium]
MDLTELILLEKGLEQLGLNSAQLQTNLERFLYELERWNPQFGFVHASGKELILKHVLDSLSGASFFRSLAPSRVGDLGSGAGFPGIPLALALPHVHFTLIEPSQKRATFLRTVQSILQLKNLQICDKDLGYLVRHLSKNDLFPCITFRAFQPLTLKGLKQMLNILQEGGSIVAYKGKREHTEQEASVAKSLGLSAQIVKVSVPYLEEERNLLWISW